MDLRVSSDEIRSYVSAQAKIIQQARPEESRRLVLRLPTDSVNISPMARALQQGHLRVAIEEDGRYAEVTDESSNPVLRLLDEGMSDIKQHLDKMKELTELMKDEELGIEDRYHAQMKIVDLEGEVDKRLHKLYEDYSKLAEEQGLPTLPGIYDLTKEPLDPSKVLENMKLDADPITGEMLGGENYADMIDQRTARKKAAIRRVMMRELDPEAWAKYTEDLRETFRNQFRDLADEFGNIPDAVSLSFPQMVKAFIPTPDETKDIPFSQPDKPDPSVPEMPAMDIEALLDPSNRLDGNVYVPPEIDSYELAMEAYVEERLAALEEYDYKAINGMRVSVMSAELAEESGDYLENMTNQLTEQFQKFAAVNELLSEEQEDFSPEALRERKFQLATIAKDVLTFIRDSVLADMRQDTVREEKGGYDYKAEKPDSDPMNGVRDIFAPIPMTPEEIWQRYRPDLFSNAEV